MVKNKKEKSHVDVCKHEFKKALNKRDEFYYKKGFEDGCVELIQKLEKLFVDQYGGRSVRVDSKRGLVVKKKMSGGRR